MKAIIKDFGFEVEIRKMGKDEMPDDGIVYYCDDESKIIYKEDELDLSLTPISHEYKTMKQINQTTYEFPHWSKIAKTYSEAVQKRMDEIEATRPFYNWRKDQIDESHLRETKEKIAGMKTVTKKGIVTMEVQLGQKWKGTAVQDVRKQYTEGEIGMGAYEMLTILLINPKILSSYDDLWIDCPGDEFDASGSDVRFDRAPCLFFSDDKVGFGTERVSLACGFFGSASGWAVSGSTNNLTYSNQSDTIKKCPTKTMSQNFKLSTKELEEGVTLRVTLDILNMADEE